jgi:hypothetical protein
VLGGTVDVGEVDVVVVVVSVVSEVSDVSDVSVLDVPEVSDTSGRPKSVVTGVRVVVIVGVVVDFEVFVELGAKVGGMKSIGASSGPLAEVSATAAHTTSPITKRAAKLAPATTGVE